MSATPRQVAVVPFRRNDGEIEICLIRRQDSRKWGIPKGFIDRGYSAEEAALTEAFEEAGLKGEILADAIGTYEYKKWQVRLVVAVYIMKVHDVETKWPEKSFRERKWASVEKAAELLEKHPVHPLLSEAIKRLPKRRA